MDPKIKLLRFPDRVQGILDGNLQPPIMADVDVISGRCNIDCEWCVQRTSREAKETILMPIETMKRIGSFCKEWGVKSWRIAGDSEPTLNPNLYHLLNSGYDNGIDMGLITNGILLDEVKDIHLLKWVGISLDAATATTWARLKHSPEKNFHRIISNINHIRDTTPGVEVSIKFIKWSAEVSLSREDFSASKGTVKQGSNYNDAEILPQLAKALGVKYTLRDAFPKNSASQYQFNVCRATPLYATFGADHKFYICCDVRTGYILTGDYTQDNWQELHKLWGSQKHKDILASIDPSKCKFCSKEWLNTIIENIILDGKHTKEYQVNFI